GGLLEVLVEDDAGDLGLDRAHLAAVLDGGEGLGVEGVLVGDAAGQEDVDDGLGGPFLEGLALAGLEAEELAEAEAEAADEADLEEAAAGGAAEVGGVVIP